MTYPHVFFQKVDVDEVKEIAAEYRIEAMPTFHFIKKGEKIDSIIGTKKDELEAKVRKHAAQPVSASA
ncbi:hypothetical protein HU200_016036 [Digitaria exilis]|uniref:Thioredoxin domain-containing protein n=1 Tax=Digitaria exilis TaxID=1010633 RepID=A0A835F9G3_9POAL|nr:hypothetical protein HU200_016036 [Digitaria exilis]